MQYILGIILNDNDIEILENESPGKGSYMGLPVVINNARLKMKQDPKIKKINIYNIKHGQRSLVYWVLPEV